MKEELDQIEKNHTCELVQGLVIKMLLGQNGCSKTN